LGRAKKLPALLEQAQVFFTREQGQDFTFLNHQSRFLLNTSEYVGVAIPSRINIAAPIVPLKRKSIP
jgi:hypothetical protein